MFASSRWKGYPRGVYHRCMETLNLAIESMSCQACVRQVTKALQKVQGVTVKQVNVGSATVEIDPAVTPPQAVISVLADAGFPAQPTVKS